MSMKTMLRGLLVTAMLIIVGTPVSRAGDAAVPAPRRQWVRTKSCRSGPAG